jgi:hypothetical protein
MMGLMEGHEHLRFLVNFANPLGGVGFQLIAPTEALPTIRDCQSCDLEIFHQRQASGTFRMHRQAECGMSKS